MRTVRHESVLDAPSPTGPRPAGNGARVEVVERVDRTRIVAIPVDSSPDDPDAFEYAFSRHVTEALPFPTVDRSLQP